MQEVEIVEGCWVEFQYEEKILKGRVERKWKDRPLSRKNFWVKRNDGYYQPSLEDIIRVFPKVGLKFNPSSR